MTYDPNDNRPDLRDRRPDLVNNNIDARRGASWVPWVAVLAVLLIGVFIWGNMGGEPGPDPATTSSTATPEASDTAPAPIAPAPGGATNNATPAPATPPAAGGTTNGG